MDVFIQHFLILLDALKIIKDLHEELERSNTINWHLRYDYIVTFSLEIVPQ